MELAEVPARNLADHIIKSRFEESRSAFGDGIGQLEQAVAKTEFGRDESQRISCSLRSKRRRTAKPCIDLYYAVIITVGVISILHVTFANDAEMTDYLYGCVTQQIDVVVIQRLARSHDYTLARMDSQRVEILHVADRDAIVILVTDNFILYLLPALERFLDQHLRRVGESLACLDVKLSLVVAEAAAKAAEGVCGTKDNRITYLTRRLTGLRHAVDGMGTDYADTDFLHAVGKSIPVFGINYSLNRRAEHAYSIFFQNAAVVECYSAVKSRLTTEGQHDAVRPLLLDDLLNKKRSYRQQIDAVRHTFRSLHSRDVGIDENSRNALFRQSLESLAATVVKFTGLPYLQRSGAEQKNFVELFHSIDTKRLNKYMVSSGPLEASG